VVQQAWPDVRSADELHDVLLTLCRVPAEAGSERGPAAAAGAAGAAGAWACFFEELRASGRARRSDDGFWIATERSEASLLDCVRGWIGVTGPVTARALAQRLCVAGVDVELAQLESEGLVLRGRFTGGQELEWCERSLLSRIHRLTLGRLRREIEPVATTDFLRFLFRWQHVHAGTQLHGALGLAEVLAQLQGFQVAAGAWESEVLPARVARYDKSLLDQLCLSGEIAWGRLSCSDELAVLPRRPPGRATPLALVRRDDLPWLLRASRGAGGASEVELPLGARARLLDDEPLGARARLLDDEPLSDRSRLVVALLEQRGALFPHELRAQTGLSAPDLEDALWELVSGGRLTCDGFGALRALLDPKSRAASGRWSLLRSGHDETFRDEPFIEQLAAQYLRRYGVVFRDLLAREPRCPPWRELLRVYRTLEARGELRGGRFAQAFSGEQFALPEAVEALRAVRRAPKNGVERVELSATDPLNLVGILTPGPRVPAFAQNRVVFIDGVPQSTAELRTA
jgi:ATP-dependent Lhr-like helicase